VDSLRTDLAVLVGDSRVLTDPQARAALAVDAKVPDWIISPATGEQVASVLRYAAAHDLALIPCCGGTKLATGNPPRRYDIALSMNQLNHVRHYEPADLTISVEAGMTLADFQDLVGGNGLWLPLDPRGGARASLGGIIAANAAGPLRQGFGGPRDMVLGLKIATTDGKVAKTGGRVVKNVAGYDLAKLLTGSYGTLGVVVEASLKLFPRPPERATFTIRIGTLEIARDLRRSILCSPLNPLRLVLLGFVALRLVRGAVQHAVPGGAARAAGPSGLELWIEMGGSRRVLERCERELGQLASAVGATLERLEGAETAWEYIADPAIWLQKKNPDLTVLKAALPVAASEEFLRRARQEAQTRRIVLASFAQVGVGIVHLCVLPASAGRQDTPSTRLADFVLSLRKATQDFRGTLIIECGAVDLKSRVDVWGPAGDDLEAMRRMKAAWDPKGILTPGRFLGGI
jgi:glycolate oxidase FAD binding subunit